MQEKKSPKANLEKYRGMFVLIGLVISLSLVFMSINVSKADVVIKDMGNNSDYFPEDIPVMNTKTEEPKPPKPKMSQVNQDIIDVVPDDVVIKFSVLIPRIEDTIIFYPGVIDEDPIFTPDTDSILDFPSVAAVPSVDIMEFLAKNIDYPQDAIDNEIEGTVYLRFVVTKTGEVGAVEVVRGIDPLLDNEAVRVVKLLPDFKPASNNGRSVNVWFRVPIVFKLTH